MNIIYFNPDEMRASALACYGHPLIQTPNIDRLAREGTRFDQCHVQHTVCTPSRCSFMTGWYPHVRGHRTLWHCLRKDEPNTLKYLKQTGYDVHWWGKNDLLAPDSFEESVTEVHKITGQGAASPAYSEDDSRRFNFLTGPLDGHANDYHKLQDAIRFLKERKGGDAPFMMYLPFTNPHCPYNAPEPWHSMYRPDDIPPLLASDLESKPDFHRFIRNYRQLDDGGETELRKIMAVYLGMVSYVDHLVGLVLDALDDTGLAASTAVFFFSDHGDWAGDYGLVEKWPSGLDDCLTRVPMIIRVPGMTAGHVVKEPVECFDIMPTTLELAGIEVQHTHFATSMLPQLNGAAGDPGRAVFAEGGYDLHEPQCFEGKPSDTICGNPDSVYYPKGVQQQEQPLSVCRATMVRTASHKLIRRPASRYHELYDMSNDPDELHNLWGTPQVATVQQELMTRMLDWYIQTSDVTPFDTDPRGFQGEDHL